MGGLLGHPEEVAGPGEVSGDTGSGNIGGGSGTIGGSGNIA